MGRLHIRTVRKLGLSRRDFLKRAGAGAAVTLTPALLTACGNSEPPLLPEAGATTPLPSPAPVLTLNKSTPFLHGVASGDPLPGAVILWTRVTPDVAATIPVSVKVYRDVALKDLVREQSTSTDASRDYTVKIDFTGLDAGKTYYYRFSALGFDSFVGRTRTAPTGNVSRLRFGVVSCSLYAQGYFNAYGALAKRLDLDAIIHLGDYIYEHAAGTGERKHLPDKACVTLADYRTRYAQYHQDPDLMALHKQTPFINIWDDHETSDNSYRDGADSHSEATQGPWSARKAAGQQAFFEWIPIRQPEPGNNNRIWRSLSYGNLCDILLPDTRLQKDKNVTDVPAMRCDTTIFSPTRTLLGAQQEQWYADTVRGFKGKWKLLCSSVQLAQWKAAPGLDGGQTCGGIFLNADEWDGFDAARRKVHAILKGDATHPAIDNAICIAGDIHSAWASDIVPDPNNPTVYNPATGSGSLAVEWVSSSVTSQFPSVNGQQLDGNAFIAANPAHKYIHTLDRGYLILDLDATRASGEWWYVSTIASRSTAESFGAAYQCVSGAKHMTMGAQTTPPASPSPAAP